MMGQKIDAEVVSEAAAMIGRLGGMAKSPAKAAASRENGKLGGRPPIKRKRKAKAKRKGAA